MFFRLHVLAEPADERYLVHVTDEVLLPLMTRSRPAPGDDETTPLRRDDTTPLRRDETTPPRRDEQKELA
jgi:hypothetical protein